MPRSITASLAFLTLIVSLLVSACESGGERSSGMPTEERERNAQSPGEFLSATAKVDVSGDVETKITLTNLRSAEIVDGMFEATIASTDDRQSLSIAAPDRSGSASTGTGDAALSLKLMDRDTGDVQTFVADEGSCTITLESSNTVMQGNFICTGLASEDGRSTIDAAGPFAVDRD